MYVIVHQWWVDPVTLREARYERAILRVAGLRKQSVDSVLQVVMGQDHRDTLNEYQDDDGNIFPLFHAVIAVVVPGHV